MQTSESRMPEKIAVGMVEAARLAAISRRSLENYIAMKMLPSRKIGRRRVVLVRDLEKFLSADRPSASRTAAREVRQ